ncbi:MAG: hypothetical protein FWG74_09595 [Planctomycetes bacterium]|nr:hypothetical protein [Planctomycetota bacterium]
MNILRKIKVFGDSILKGIQLDPITKRYHINNNIGVDMLSEKFSLSITNHSKFGCTITKGKIVLGKYLDKASGALDVFFARTVYTLIPKVKNS